MVVLADNPTVGVRYYNAVTGRYINRDPGGYADGLNPYLYVHNNPINRIDPLGLWDWGWKALAVIGNISSGIADAVTFGAVGAIQDHMGVSGSVDRTGIAYKVGTVAASVNPTGLAKGVLREAARVIVNEVKSEAVGAVQGAVLEKVDEATGLNVSGVVANAQIAKAVLGAHAGQGGQAKSGIKPEASGVVAKPAAPAAPAASSHGLGVSDPPSRVQGPWTERDLARAKEGKGPLDLIQKQDKNGKEMPLELHHADQMPGSAIHEVDRDSHREPGVHGQSNKGVTPEMRKEDAQLHWQLRGQEMGNPPPGQ
jgi:hypothetical protein